MAQRSISKPTAAAVVYPVNHRAKIAGVSIQNNTGAAIGVKLTNKAIQRETPVWSDPATGVLSIAAGASDLVSQNSTAFQFSGTGTGSIDITEVF